MIKNYTPHSVIIMRRNEAGDGYDVVADIPSSGMARVEARTEVVGSMGSIPLTRSVYGEVTSLPEPSDGVSYIVSRLVASALPDRNDLLVPGQLVRDEQGRVIGCGSLEVPS